MTKRQVVNHVQDGEVLLVDKEVALPQKTIELSHRQAEKLLRPKAPRTEAQIENTKRLVELNRQRANAWREKVGVQSAPKEEESKEAEVPSDKVAIKIKPKRSYNRKVPPFNSPELQEKMRPQTAQPPPTPSAPVQKAPPKRRAAPITYYESDEESDEESEEEDIPQPLPKKKEVKKKIQKSGKRIYTSETSESETTDTDAEMFRVQKYVKKAEERAAAVKKIDEKLKQVSNKYMAAGLSVF